MAKSVTAALIGILVKEGKLKVKIPAPVPEWQKPNDSRHAITLEQLLQQTSGLQFEENYTKASEATNMLFKRGDMAAFAAQRPLQYKPGTVFNYSSGNSNILSRVIRQTLGESAYHSFPYEGLFYKIGMYSAILEPDASGTFVGSSFMYATARDWARFGMLYYNNGVWNGKQILPDGWVKKTSFPSAADSQKHYGYQFWLNGFDKKNLSKRIYADVPPDMYFADGFGGQEVYIIPSKKLVVVRLGLHSFDENGLLKSIIECVPAN
jgi:CubicO group peptidase (beta-lactamase class C family)